MTFPVGSLTAFISVRGAAQARQDVLAVSQSMAEAGAAASESAAGFERVDAALAGTARVSTTASSAASKLRASQLDQVAAVERYNKVLADENATLAQVARAEAALIRANERVAASTPVAGAYARPFTGAAAEADAATAGVSRFRSGMSSTLGMAKSLGLLFGAVEAAKMVLDIGRQASQFQRDMLLIQTQAGASADTVDYLSKKVLAMSGQVATAPDKLAESLYHIVSAGQGILTTAQDLDILRIAAEGAQVGNADIVETTNALTAAVASGISGVKDYSQAMGALNAIVGAGDMKLSDLNEALGSGILAQAKAFGVTLAEVGAGLATFGDNNIRGADAATKLRMAIQDLAKPAANADKVLAKIHLTSDDLRQSLSNQGLTGALHLLENRMTSAGITGDKVGGFLEDAFTKKAGAGLAVLIEQSGRFDEKLVQIAAGANNFNSQWNATTKSTSYQFKTLGAEFTSAGIAIEQHLMPYITEAAHILGVVLPAAFHDLSTVIGPVAPMLGKVGVAVGAMWLAFQGYKLARAAIVGIIDIVETLQLRAMYAADAIVAAGAEAEIGWTGLLGPLALAAIGITTLITLFHHSSQASKEAKDAAQAYSDALKSGDDLGSTIVEQLNKADVPQTIQDLNELSAGMHQFQATEFSTAIESGGKSLADLRAELQANIDANTKLRSTQDNTSIGYALNSRAIEKAKKLLTDLNTQYTTLSDTAQKDLQDTAAFAGVSSSIDKVSAVTKVASKTAGEYAQMLGITVDKNGIAAVSADVLTKAVDTVSSAYNNATATGDEFLAALSTFASSAGTAADRAALIGATLKAANGDALAYVGAMASAADANRSLVNAFQQQSDQLASQSKDQVNAISAVKAAQQRVDEVRKNSKHTASEMSKAELALTKAQQKAGSEQALSYADTERAAISFSKGVKGALDASIDYTKTGAPALVQQLQSIQTAAMQAAQATYQHEVATKGAKVAADEAYQVYQNETSKALIDNRKQLGLTLPQAQALADTYFGMPKDVKTQIEAEGTDPILTVLNKIGQLLANFTHQPWDIEISVNDVASKQIGHIKSELDDLNAQKSGGYTSGTSTSHPTYGPAPHKYATGGNVRDGWFVSGDAGPELGYKDGPRVKIFSNQQSQKMSPDMFGTKPSVVKHQPIEINVYNPVPERASESVPTAIRRATMRLDG